MFQVGQYKDSVTDNSVWSTGDWTGDRKFDSSDLDFAFESGGYELQNGGSGFAGLPEHQKETMLKTLREVRDAGVDMAPFSDVLKLSKRQLEDLLKK